VSNPHGQTFPALTKELATKRPNYNPDTLDSQDRQIRTAQQGHYVEQLLL
jgi:hypothetical protein